MVDRLQTIFLETKNDLKMKKEIVVLFFMMVMYPVVISASCESQLLEKLDEIDDEYRSDRARCKVYRLIGIGDECLGEAERSSDEGYDKAIDTYNKCG